MDAEPLAILDDADALRAHYGEPVPLAVAVVKPRLDAHHRHYIEHCPFLCLAAAGPDGQPSVSPRGDAPGFVRVLDDRTLLIPDRPGNNKVETWHHVVANPKVALVLFVPGVAETLRLHGIARLSRDPAHLAAAGAQGRPPPAVLVVEVTQVYFHCGKAIIRSRLWAPESQVAPGTLPAFAQVLKEQAGVPEPVAHVQDVLDDVYANKLY